MLDRLKHVWKLSKKDPHALIELSKHLNELPDAGDGGAVFLGEGTQQEYKQMQDDDKGLKGIFGL